MNGPRIAGAGVAVLTPFGADLAPDVARLVKICQALLANGAGGLAVFGTTGEANSISAAERRPLLEGLVEGGVPAAKLMPGVGAASFTEAGENIAASVEAGCGGALLLPPFYYKGVTDDGVFAFVSEAINRAAARGAPPRIYLYHIPRLAVAGFSFDLIERLLEAFPGVVVGIKDSSGDMANTLGMLERFENFDVFCGSENFLVETLRHGGRGCISAVGNVNIAEIAKLAGNWEAQGAPALQAKLTAIRQAFQPTGPIPTMKRLIAHKTGVADWARVRAPLVGIDGRAVTELEIELARLDYAPGDIFERLR